jgi:hypothetical protein
MARVITVKLGDEEVQIEQLRTRATSEWRKQVAEPAEAVVLQVAKVIDWRSVDTDDLAALRDLIGAVRPLLFDFIDTVRGLVVAYAPSLRERIEDAYDDEVIAAFLAIVRVAFPLGEIQRAVSLITNLGSPTPPTTPSSPSANGAAETTT